jgi:alpha-L-fucosidase
MRQHSRAIYGCGPSPFAPPLDCRYTQNGKRLYLHFMDWPFGLVHCPGLAGKVEYAQFLHDGSEVQMKGLEKWQQQQGAAGKGGADALALKLPTVKPDAEIPVIELFLKK